MNNITINEKDAKRSRIFYMFKNDFEYIVTLLVGDSYFSMLLTKLSFSDDKIGIISSLVSLSYVFELLAFFFVPIVKNTKVFATTIHAIAQMLFGSMYLLPLIPMNLAYKKVLIIIIILLSYLGNYSVNSLISRWGNSFVDKNKRSTFSAKNDMLSLFTGAVVQLVSGIIIDSYLGLDDYRGCFLFIAISIFVFSLSDLVCLISMKREVKEVEKENSIKLNNIIDEDKESLFVVFKKLFKNKSYMKLVFVSCLYLSEMYICIIFLGTYKINELSMSMTLVQLVNIIGVMTRFMFSIPLGKYADKTTYVKGSTLGFIITLLSYVILMFTAPKTWFLIIPFMMIYHTGLGALSTNLGNGVYGFVEEKYISQAIALRLTVAGTVGFLSSLVGGWILKIVQNNNNTVFGITIYGQQVLAFISFIIVLIALIFNKVSFEKDKITKI